MASNTFVLNLLVFDVIYFIHDYANSFEELLSVFSRKVLAYLYFTTSNHCSPV